MTKQRVKKLFIFILLLPLLAIFVNSQGVSAADLGDAFTGNFLKKAGGSAGYETHGLVGVSSIIARIIQTALAFLGVVFLILAIYGGYLWMTAKGNEEQLTKAKNTLTAAVIGLIIVIGAYAISYFVIERLGRGTLKE